MSLKKELCRMHIQEQYIIEKAVTKIDLNLVREYETEKMKRFVCALCVSFVNVRTGIR